MTVILYFKLTHCWLLCRVALLVPSTLTLQSLCTDCLFSSTITSPTQRSSTLWLSYHHLLCGSSLTLDSPGEDGLSKRTIELLINMHFW